MYNYARYVELYKNISGMYKISIYLTSPIGSLPVVLKLNGLVWFNRSFHWVSGHLLNKSLLYQESRYPLKFVP